MSQTQQAIATIFKQNGLSVTKQRLTVITLLDGQEPLSMHELYDRIKGQVDRASLYRTITLFEKLDIVHRIYVGWKYKLELSDQFTRHHHHLSCLQCGKVIDIEDEQHIDDFIQQVAKQFGFQPRRHRFEVDGLCADCMTKQAV